MSISIAILADLHFADQCALSARRGDLAHILLERAVRRLDRLVHPDVTLVLGDLLDDPHALDARERLQRLKAILDTLSCPVIAIPGNHDPVADAFYEVLERPAPVVEIAGARFLPFLDCEEPGYNARRSPADMERLRNARRGFTGPIITLHHVPVLPPGATPCPYSYSNLETILDSMAEEGVNLAVGGHYHQGTELVRQGQCAYLAAPALCEAPFAFSVVTLDGDHVTHTRHALRMPRELALFDHHVHTQFAYCSSDMDMARSVELADLLGLDGLAFTEHSGQLYFERKAYWSAAFCPEGIQTTNHRDRRMDQYWQAAKDFRSDSVLVGLEVDADYQGYPVVTPTDFARAELRVGAVHYLPELKQPNPDAERLADEFLSVATRFVGCGIEVLAHPFRVFTRAKLPVPHRLINPLIALLREHGVAAELSVHMSTPNPAFYQACIENGIKLAFSSDAHALWEQGEFAPHLHMLAEWGYAGDLCEILHRPRRQ